MQSRSTSEIRNAGFFGHSASGKTTLAEAILYAQGLIDRMGRIEDGSTVLDHDPDEVKRHFSVRSALAALEHGTCKVNLLDTPGFSDFAGECVGAMAAVEAAILVVSAPAGVEVGTETHWRAAETAGVARIVCLSKMDQENADFEKAVAHLQTALSPSAVPLHLPIGAAEGFSGLIDLIGRVAYTFDEKGKALIGAVPAELAEAVERCRARLVEKIAETDDALTERYLQDTDLPVIDIRRGLREGTSKGRIFPVVCVSAVRHVGIETFLDLVAELVPPPDARGEVTGRLPGSEARVVRRIAASEPFSGRVFKTAFDPYVGRLTYVKVLSGVLRTDTPVLNSTKQHEEKHGLPFTMRGKKHESLDAVNAGDIAVLARLTHTATGDTLCDRNHPVVFPPIRIPDPCFSLAVHPKSTGDDDKLGIGLARLVEEDPTFRAHRDAQTQQTIISGLGELHLEVMRARLERLHVEVETELPQVAYKETVRGHAVQEGRHKKQSGGHGQFGHVRLEIAPLPRGRHFEFHDRIVGGVVPKSFIPSVEKGVRKAMEEGVVAGYPLVDIQVTLCDGSYHTVDSSDIAFQIAAGLAIREGVKKAAPILLEPIVHLDVTVPERYTGDVIGDLNAKRGRILGLEPASHDQQTIRAQIPQAEVLRYALDLRSLAHGRGSFALSFSHYEEVPGHQADAIISAAAARKE